MNDSTFDRRRRGPPPIPPLFAPMLQLGFAAVHSMARLLLTRQASKDALLALLTSHGYHVETTAEARYTAHANGVTVTVEALPDGKVQMTGPGFELTTFVDGEYLLVDDYWSDRKTPPPDTPKRRRNDPS